ncbi:DUF2200 domain-containing protein [Vagococcus sp. DIV0080]|uniref:DUF2200 domain-containing protein n=1 Tax=Candidatus Vagococcus giribetii TaxID=2230876 RepID=A0ABS3HV64_9ENTE|nr:DUF2200 domain-containing protein [Vagococcus sp. DIV0080]MBO0477551.1 DUF2200 domain-containing protein [Vagococcus sp. DIV0080]
MTEHKVFSMSFASIYPLYLTKIEKKGRNQQELDQVITWLTGFNKEGLESIMTSGESLRDFFDKAPKINPNASLITGVICGCRVEEIEDPLMQKIRYMDKLVDELAKGKKMEKILRA